MVNLHTYLQLFTYTHIVLALCMKMTIVPQIIEIKIRITKAAYVLTMQTFLVIEP